MTQKKSYLVPILIGVFFILGVIYQGIMRLDYESKPKVFNTLGLNPSVKWVGKQAPDFTLTELHTGKKLTLSKQQGNFVILDFWASWCHTCKKQLPVLQKVYNEPKIKSKVKFYSINMKEPLSPPALRIFARQHGYDFPILLSNEALVKKYDIWFFPAMLILDKTGKVVYSGAEFHSENKIRSILKKIL